ncbi:hypothetical protein HDU76_009731, partial [Blyttiomyces sp. JEL0837]
MAQILENIYEDGPPREATLINVDSVAHKPRFQNVAMAGQKEVDGEDGDNDDDDEDSDFMFSDSDDDGLVRDGKGRKQHVVHDMDDMDDETGGPGAIGPKGIRTKHEIDVLPPVEPVNVALPDDIKLHEIGTIDSHVEDQLIVKSSRSGDVQVLDEDSILFLQDKTIVGKVFETFGPVACPLYSIRFNSSDEIDREKYAIGVKVYSAPNLAHFVFTKQLRVQKGSDASNVYDEEVAEDEIEFSDDEQEAEYRRSRKEEKRRAAGGNERLLNNAETALAGGRHGLPSGAGGGSQEHGQNSRRGQGSHGIRGGGESRGGRGGHLGHNSAEGSSCHVARGDQAWKRGGGQGGQRGGHVPGRANGHQNHPGRILYPLPKNPNLANNNSSSGGQQGLSSNGEMKGGNSWQARAGNHSMPSQMPSSATGGYGGYPQNGGIGMGMGMGIPMPVGSGMSIGNMGIPMGMVGSGGSGMRPMSMGASAGQGMGMMGIGPGVHGMNGLPGLSGMPGMPGQAPLQGQNNVVTGSAWLMNTQQQQL